nr:hypothetical protein [Bacteroidota bacterium]
ETLQRTYQPDHVRKAAIEELRPLQLSGALASLHSKDPIRTAYSGSLHIAYELGLTYHGAILDTIPREMQLEQLRDHNIKYFAVWQNMPWNEGELLIEIDPPAPEIFRLK